ncbi:MAG TPA: hypothetical protein VFD82_22390 [Planctomycetota bacterium]|nr:hypothetical protein [Planctomycetota bacterium]
MRNSCLAVLVSTCLPICFCKGQEKKEAEAASLPPVLGAAAKQAEDRLGPEAARYKGAAESKANARAALARIAAEEYERLSRLAKEPEGEKSQGRVEELQDYLRTLKLATDEVVLEETVRSEFIENMSAFSKAEQQNADKADLASWKELDRALQTLARADSYLKRRLALVKVTQAMREPSVTKTIRFKVVDAAGKEVQGAIVKCRFYDEPKDKAVNARDVTPNAVAKLSWGKWIVYAEVNNEDFTGDHPLTVHRGVVDQFLLCERKAKPSPGAEKNDK